MAIAVISGIVFTLLGIIGGLSAYDRWWRSHKGLWIFKPLAGSYFGIALFFSLYLTFSGIRSNIAFALLFFAFFPFSLGGSLCWGVAFAMEFFAYALGEGELHVERTFDVAEGMMIRGRYAEAEEEYRKHLVEEPWNTHALLGACRARVKNGQAKEAAQELSDSLRNIINRSEPGPKPNAAMLERINAKTFREERILRIVLTLGDLYVEHLNDIPRACALYEDALKVLAGNTEAEALRHRLEALKHPDRVSFQVAVESAQPRTILLPDE